MEQFRTVETRDGWITYLLRHKRVKNLNLHLERGGQPVLSVPMHCPEADADRFIREKSQWIIQGRKRMERLPAADLGPERTREESYQYLKGLLDQVYPLAARLGVAYPELRLRRMKSQWGNCHWRQGYITLNTALARCPETLGRYVALHELVHFLYPNHGPQFHACMDLLMPQWKEYRKELKEYSAALVM